LTLTLEHPSAVEALRRLLNDPNWLVRYDAEWQLENEELLPPYYAPSLGDRVLRVLFTQTERDRLLRKYVNRKG
jgi:hypothetical protein